MTPVHAGPPAPPPPPPAPHAEPHLHLHDAPQRLWQLSRVLRLGRLRQLGGYGLPTLRARRVQSSGGKSRPGADEGSGNRRVVRPRHPHVCGARTLARGGRRGGGWPHRSTVQVAPRRLQRTLDTQPLRLSLAHGGGRGAASGVVVGCSTPPPPPRQLVSLCALPARPKLLQCVVF